MATKEELDKLDEEIQKIMDEIKTATEKIIELLKKYRCNPDKDIQKKIRSILSRFDQELSGIKLKEQADKIIPFPKK
ncbi:MAG: hypothetical protein WAX69_16870 [Victivallales bacterium]